DDARNHAAHVAIADHGSLGFSRGARGIDHQPDVFELLAVQLAVDGLRLGGILLGAQALHVGKGADEFAHVWRVTAQPLALDDHDTAQSRQILADLEHFFGLLLVFAHDELDVGMIQDVADFRRGAGGIYTDRDAPDRPRAQLCQYPFDTVFR